VLDFRILGPLEVLLDDEPVRLGGLKQRATLAILLLDANRVVPVERLADDLYAGEPPVTAVTQVQRQISELRKLLGADAIETRAPGYLLHVDPDGRDLDRFERWTYDATVALGAGDALGAADLLARALGLWRGAPLSDLAYEPFAQPAIARLDELRLAALEQQIEAALALGRESVLIPELETLVWDHPLRERLRGQLMVALYRTGRQADALELYRKTRQLLVEELGIEPSVALAELEQQILRQDPALDRPRPAELVRAVLLVPAADDAIAPLLSLAEPLARRPDRSLIVARVVATAEELPAASAAVAKLHEQEDVKLRTAVFTSLEPARDVVRLAASYDVELILVAARSVVDLAALAARAPCDLAVLYGDSPPAGDGIAVPFGGNENDWAALELAAWLASMSAGRLTLVGTAADPAAGRRDASRLLADASLAVQRVIGVSAEPVLAERTEEGLAAALAGAGLVVAGFGSDRLVERSAAPVLLVQRGARPGGLAPRESLTCFSWSLQL